MTTISNNLKKDPIPALIKVREVAELLSVSRHTVHHLIDSGDLHVRPISPTKEKPRGGTGKKGPRDHVRITRVSLLKFYKGRFGHALTAALANPFES